MDVHWLEQVQGVPEMFDLLMLCFNADLTSSFKLHTRLRSSMFSQSSELHMAMMLNTSASPAAANKEVDVNLCSHIRDV